MNLTLLAQAEIRANPKELEEPQELLKKGPRIEVRLSAGLTAKGFSSFPSE